VAVLRLVEVMRRHEHGGAGRRERADQVPELPAGERIHAGGGFVEKEDGRPVEDGASQGQALLGAP
jgi:hypothetical protein